MSRYGSITVRGESLELTKRGRVLVDILSVSGVVLCVYVLVVCVAFLE